MNHDSFHASLKLHAPNRGRTLQIGSTARGWHSGDFDPCAAENVTAPARSAGNRNEIVIRPNVYRTIVVRLSQRRVVVPEAAGFVKPSSSGPTASGKYFTCRWKSRVARRNIFPRHPVTRVYIIRRNGKKTEREKEWRKEAFAHVGSSKRSVKLPD